LVGSIEDAEGRDAKLEHPVFRALWRRALDFMAAQVEAYGAPPSRARRHACAAPQPLLPL
jgi:hypothetical protein